MEPKFQCWDREYGQMYTNAWPFEHLVYVEMPQDDPEVQRRESSMHKVNGKWFYFLLRKDVDLREYTGRKDKHGKEIFEVDIVRVDSLYETQHAKVVWGPVNNMYTWMNGETWLLHFVKGAEGPLYPYCQAQHGYGVSVAGNIYEHPHLLEKAE